jgi:hypothetical protein
MNTAISGIFSANINASQAIGTLAVKAASARLTSGVNKLV